MLDTIPNVRPFATEALPRRGRHGAMPAGTLAGTAAGKGGASGAAACPADQIDRICALARTMLAADAVTVVLDGSVATPAPATTAPAARLSADLVGADGTCHGTLLALWTQPHEPGPSDVRILADFAALAGAAVDLWRQARQDTLTGAMTRGAFLDRLEQALSARRRSGTPLTVVMLDLDHFKRVNDGLGHAAGDAVLRAVASALRSGLRGGDDLGRLGGEEFALMLEGADGMAAAEIAERLRETLGSLSIPGYPGLHVTASFGVAEAGLGCDDADSLLAAADACLYASKRAGRDCVRVAQPPVRRVA